MRHKRILASSFFVLAAMLGAAPLWAQFNPERAYQQSAAVTRHYPDPAVRFDTPAFAPGKADFTSHQEMMDFIYGLQKTSTNLQVRIIGASQEGRAHYFTRTPAHGIDVNRDHFKMDLPETVALHRAINEFQPEVFVDAHEFSVATRWLEKFGKVLAYDLTLLYATNPNVQSALTALADGVYRRNIVRDVEGAGYSHFWYFTTSYNPADKKVAMGGTSPDIGRNTAGLQNAISFLIETRGVGIGRASYARRVHAHYVAITGLLNTTADNASQVMNTVRAARVAAARPAAAPGPDIVVTSKNPLVAQKLAMRDPQSGDLSQVEVEWDDSLGAIPELVRKRPFAYVMPPAYADVARRLAYSGVEVRRLHEPLTLEVETYQVTDKRVGTVYYEGHIRNNVTTEVERKAVAFAAGSYVYPMAQPTANVIAAALEPESPSSFVTFGIISVDRKGVGGAASEAPIYRLMQPVALDARLPARD